MASKNGASPATRSGLAFSIFSNLQQPDKSVFYSSSCRKLPARNAVRNLTPRKRAHLSAIAPKHGKVAFLRTGIFAMNPTNQEKLLAQAEHLCQQRNVRLTPQRLEVLRLMAQQPGAISAYDLLDLLRVAEPQAKPPTVYRALDFLLEQGFIHRVESTNSYVLCHHFEQPMHTSALFICDRCGQVTERTTDGIEETLQKLAKESGFALRHSVVEAHGLCVDCVEVEACKHPHDCDHDHSIVVKKK